MADSKCNIAYIWLSTQTNSTPPTLLDPMEWGRPQLSKPAKPKLTWYARERDQQAAKSLDPESSGS